MNKAEPRWWKQRKRKKKKSRKQQSIRMLNCFISFISALRKKDELRLVKAPDWKQRLKECRHQGDARRKREKRPSSRQAAADSAHLRLLPPPRQHSSSSVGDPPRLTWRAARSDPSDSLNDCVRASALECHSKTDLTPFARPPLSARTHAHVHATAGRD